MTYIADVKNRGYIFNDDEETNAHIRKIAKWMQVHSRPGLLIYGLFGNGKTTLVRSIAKLISIICPRDAAKQENRLVMISAIELNSLAKDDPEKYKDIIKEKLLAIDDVGLETTSIKNYGNQVNPFIEMIYKRYELSQFTILTSNLSMKEISEKYGARVSDRFTEMFDRQSFKNKSYRPTGKPIKAQEGQKQGQGAI